VILIVIVCAAVAFLYWVIGSSTRVDRSTGGEPMTDPSATVAG
jgi:hypothetical protein